MASRRPHRGNHLSGNTAWTLILIGEWTRAWIEKIADTEL